MGRKFRKGLLRLLCYAQLLHHLDAWLHGIWKHTCVVGKMKGGPARGTAPLKAQADDGGDAIPSSAEQVQEPEYLSGEEDYIDSDSEGRDGYRRGLLFHVSRELLGVEDMDADHAAVTGSR